MMYCLEMYIRISYFIRTGSSNFDSGYAEKWFNCCRCLPMSVLTHVIAILTKPLVNVRPKGKCLRWPRATFGI
jgi:hypothetical protein